MIASLRKIFALLLLAVFVGIGLPAVPFAGGQDDPGYTGAPGEDTGTDNGSSPHSGNSQISAGKDGQPEGKTGPPTAGKPLIRSPLPGWLVDLLGILIRVR